MYANEVWETVCFSCLCVYRQYDHCKSISLQLSFVICLPSPAAHIKFTFCRSTQTVRLSPAFIYTSMVPPHVYLDVRSTGVLLIRPVVLERSSLPAS